MMWSLPPASCLLQGQCVVSDIITSHLLALPYVNELDCLPSGVMGCVLSGGREGEREMCDVGETVNTGPQH